MTIAPRIACALLACASLAGCITEGPAPAEPTKPKPMPREVTHPVKMIVSPLTRVGLEGVGGPSLFLHLDFRDADSRGIKAFGKLHVELSQPGSPDAKTQAIAQAWDADLSDPLRNALTFDEMITRTYTITLSGIPDWLVQWTRRQGDAAAADAPSIIVTFTPRDAADSTGTLRVAYTLTR